MLLDRDQQKRHRKSDTTVVTSLSPQHALYISYALGYTVEEDSINSLSELVSGNS
jgi:hypothetical protein